jgi:hypothetical protein
MMFTIAFFLPIVVVIGDGGLLLVYDCLARSWEIPFSLTSGWILLSNLTQVGFGSRNVHLTEQVLSCCKDA